MLRVMRTDSGRNLPRHVRRGAEVGEEDERSVDMRLYDFSESSVHEKREDFAGEDTF
jgi:hypothetical protein